MTTDSDAIPPGFQRYRAKLATLIGDAVVRSKPQTVLDFGAGDGRFAGHLAGRLDGALVVAVESMIRPDRAKRASFVCYDGKRLPFRDGSFDVVVIQDVLHHCESPEDTLREARRVASGRLIIKDHLPASRLDYMKLLLLDWVGNCRFGVGVTGTYLNMSRWRAALDSIGAESEEWAHCLPLREGWASRLFSNCLEVMIEVKLPAQ